MSAFETVSRWDPNRVPPVLRWLLAALIVGLAVAARIAIDAELPPGFPYLTFFPAVVIGTFFLGTHAGTAIATACGLAAWY